MAPASIVVRLTESLVAGYESYGFKKPKDREAYSFPEVIKGNREKLTRDQHNPLVEGAIENLELAFRMQDAVNQSPDCSTTSNVATCSRTRSISGAASSVARRTRIPAQAATTTTRATRCGCPAAA